MMSKKTRWLVQTLILSLILNCTLALLFFYFLVKGGPAQFAYSPREEAVFEDPQVEVSFLSKLATLSFKQLTELLHDERQLVSGFLVRDLALGALVSLHDVDIKRGLGRELLIQKQWQVGQIAYSVFPGLSSADFQMMQYFLQREKWPLTSKGLFKRIAADGIGNADPELVSFFCHTSEWTLLETLCARSSLPIKRRALLQMALEGGWDKLAQYAALQEKGSDFSASQLRTLLWNYVEGESKVAARLFVRLFKDYAEHQLTDEQIAKLLPLLTTETDYLQGIANSGREEDVCELAARFIPRAGTGELRPLFRESPPRSPSPSTHIVQPGESLWQISKKYHVTVEDLMAVNHLQSTVLRAGKTLTIPHH